MLLTAALSGPQADAIPTSFLNASVTPFRYFKV